MRKTIEKKVLEYCNKHQMLQQKDRVVLGVSGGADSVCLLFVLLGLRRELNLSLHVVHVNHGIRQEAGEDAAYVKALCEANDLPFYLYEEDIPVIAKARGCSEEEAGRQVRYEAFAEVFRLQGCTKIAVAHNSNDRAETMLFHLFRGTGLTGLGSIRPVREQIIRPILCLERAEIEEYLAQKEIIFRHDCTNDSDDYTRNKIRHNIIPYAEQQIVQGCIGNMNRTADILAETENYIEEQLQKARTRCVLEEDSTKQPYILDVQHLLEEHTLIQKRLLLQLLKELSPGHKDIAAIHVEDIVSLFHKEGNRSIHLPYGIIGSRQYEQVYLERRVETTQGRQWEPVSIDLEQLSEEELKIPLGYGRYMYFKVLSCGKDAIISQDILQNQYTKWFDYDKIKECLMLRTRRTGDVLCIKGRDALHHKKLKDYMVTEKIPKLRRDELPVLAEGSQVLWLVGYRISEYYKVDTSTRHILEVRYTQSNRIEEPCMDGEEKIWQSM